jgi:hypothetical protein
MSDDADVTPGMRDAPRPRSFPLSHRPDARPGKPRRTRVVVIGEFNSGKTTLVNALVGAPVLAASFTTHTAHTTVVAFASRPAVSVETTARKRLPSAWDRIGEHAPQDVRRLHVGVPLQRLKGLSVIDTSGLGFADGESDAAGSLQACRNADVVIWCTPAMQAWKASEERTWLALPEGVRARGLLAVTFADGIGSPADLDRLMRRLETEAGPHFYRVVAAGDCAALVVPAHD